MGARVGHAAWWLVLVLAAAAACSEDQPLPPAQRVVVAEGLLNPVGLAALADGRVLVAEEGTGDDDHSAGVSIIDAGRAVTRLVSGLPSGRDSGDLSGVPLVGVAPDGDTVYLANFGQGHLWTLSLAAAVTASAALGPADLEPAMRPLNRVRLVNPFDIAFDDVGVPVVTDASENGVARENADGTTRFVHRFDDLRDPQRASLAIDPVPTGLARVGAEYYVTLTGGCPYPEGAGRLVAVDLERGQRTVADGLDMPIDVAVGPDGTVWVLEFARFDPEASCFTGEGYLPGTGRLSRLADGGALEPVVEGLDFPGAVVPMPDGSLYVSEVFAGKVSRITFGEKPGAAPPLTASPLQWQFREVAATVGLDFRHGAFRTGVFPDPVAGMGGGLCWIDYNADGWLDLYLVNSHAAAEAGFWQGEGGLPRNALYRNEGGSFVDVTASSGTGLAMRGNGCLAADLDGDGDTDLYVTADGPNALLYNGGDGTFAEQARIAGVAAPEWSTAAVAGDLNGDGLLDLIVGSYIDLERKIDKPSGAFPQDYLGIADRLYLNRGDATFQEVTAEAGLLRDDRTLGALLSDFDLDGDLDLYLANDGQANRLYRNDSAAGSLGFRFVDVTEEAQVGDSGSGMGVAGGDYDGDGAFDLFVTNWEAELHALYRNATGDDLGFLYSTFRIGLAGLGSGTTGWGTGWGDFDHDTDLDLVVAAGRVPVTDLDSDPELVRLYGNLLAEGERGQFRDWTVVSGLEVVGPLLARGSALADFDNDGDLDMAINSIAGPAALLRNDHPAGAWLQVGFDRVRPGTVVAATLPDGSRLVREVHAGGSYLSSDDPRLHFGLGDHGLASRLEVRWPDGRRTILEDVAAGSVLRVAPPP